MTNAWGQTPDSENKKINWDGLSFCEHHLLWALHGVGVLCRKKYVVMKSKTTEKWRGVRNLNEGGTNTFTPGIS